MTRKHASNTSSIRIIQTGVTGLAQLGGTRLQPCRKPCTGFRRSTSFPFMKNSRRLVSMLAAATLLLSSPPLVTSAFAQTSAAAQDGPIYGAELQGFDYPYPVSWFKFHSQRQDLQMAYMDVAPDPETANGRTAVLLHGKNYCAAT